MFLSEERGVVEKTGLFSIWYLYRMLSKVILSQLRCLDTLVMEKVSAIGYLTLMD